MERVRKICLRISGTSTLILILGLLLHDTSLWQAAAIATAVCVAIGIGHVEALKGYQYTAWIIVSIVAGLIYPGIFLEWGDFDLRNEYVVLFIVQGVMFGMGTQMSLEDFTRLGTTGKGVLVGLICQFSIMPLIGFILTKVFLFEPEIAAGIILIGSCSSGLASNVMVYIAGADLTLSITLTATATLLAPVMTPMLMEIFADTYVNVQFTDMFIQIIKIVIVPI
ncbi:MAG: bile acid:sodium symporter family protein, partial [Bacteroidetes bacterium]|nr:bile acid:sodium symporter family protein [Bacteroidota bacterium]